ncbi:MAG: ROK family transcriptional regulator [Spirochaetota bacterium]
MIGEPLRGNDVREKNEKLVLQIIHKSDGISQSEVVQMTGLKPPTVFRIFSSLEEGGLIESFDKQVASSERKGRRPVYYRTKSDARFIIGIDFWVRSASIVIVNFSGEPVYKEVTELHDFIDADQVVSVLKDLIEKSLQRSGVPRERLIGIGIGAPGRVDIETGTVVHYGRIRGMNNFSIKTSIEQTFGLPVFVHNNATVVALSEYRYGVATQKNNLLTVLIRSGVGGSFINDGTIFVTNNRTTLEIGHMTVDIHGRECECDHRGCLESYVSEEVLIHDIRETGVELNFDELDQAIAAQNKKVLEVLNEKARILAEGVYSLYQLFGPDSFLLVSRSEALSNYLADRIHKQLSWTAEAPAEEKCVVLPCKYDPILAGIGASDLVLDQFFQ